MMAAGDMHFFKNAVSLTLHVINVDIFKHGTTMAGHFFKGIQCFEFGPNWVSWV